MQAMRIRQLLKLVSFIEVYKGQLRYKPEVPVRFSELSVKTIVITNITDDHNSLFDAQGYVVTTTNRVMEFTNNSKFYVTV
jgi:hypothetical protein